MDESNKNVKNKLDVICKQSKQIPRDSENSVFLKISKYHGQIQTQGPKLSGNHAPHV